MSAKPDSEKSGGSLGTIFGVIPTIYYDIIARVAPGLAFLFALWLGTASATELKAARDFLEGNILIVLLLSYLVGMVLTGVSVVWDGLSFGVFWLLKPLHTPLGLDEATTFVEVWEVVAQKMDAIAKVSETSGSIVTKALAEVTLTENLLTGTVALSVLGWVSSGLLFPDFATSWKWALAALLLLLTTILFRQAMFLGRVKVLYLMHCTK